MQHGELLRGPSHPDQLQSLETVWLRPEVQEQLEGTKWLRLQQPEGQLGVEAIRPPNLAPGRSQIVRQYCRNCSNAAWTCSAGVDSGVALTTCVHSRRDCGKPAVCRTIILHLLLPLSEPLTVSVSGALLQGHSEGHECFRAHFYWHQHAGSEHSAATGDWPHVVPEGSVTVRHYTFFMVFAKTA